MVSVLQGNESHNPSLHNLQKISEHSGLQPSIFPLKAKETIIWATIVPPPNTCLTSHLLTITYGYIFDIGILTWFIGHSIHHCERYKPHI